MILQCQRCGLVVANVRSAKREHNWRHHLVGQAQYGRFSRLKEVQ